MNDSSTIKSEKNMSVDPGYKKNVSKAILPVYNLFGKIDMKLGK